MDYNIKKDYYKNLYDGVDSFDNFNSKNEIDLYKKSLINRSTDETNYIFSLISDNKLKTIFDVGCGNGRLFFDIYEKINQIKFEYLGIDVSRDRINFAKKWCKDLGINTKIFQCYDYFEKEIKSNFDLVLVLTDIFQVFGSVGKDHIFLEKLIGNLKKGSLVIIELFNRCQIRDLCNKSNNHTHNTWVEYNESDPFVFGLHRYSYINNIVSDEKIHIKRGSGLIDKGRIEHLKIYSDQDFKKLLAKYNLEIIEVFSDWNRKVYTEYNENEKKIAIAKFIG